MPLNYSNCSIFTSSDVTSPNPSSWYKFESDPGRRPQLHNNSEHATETSGTVNGYIVAMCFSGSLTSLWYLLMVGLVTGTDVNVFFV